MIQVKKLKKKVDDWNVKHSIGIKVSVLLDSGESLISNTRSEAWMLGSSSQHEGHTPVIKVDGIPGGYLLTRVTPIKEDA